ncbi:MAG: putative DNA-binding transcriptional regulator YafY [Oceanospirillaceae bacterium]|jgi:predicted DNA-binding transcriptional regulator YafY
MRRLDTLTSMLKSDDFLTVQDLAKDLGVSTRTIHRDINILRDRGLPIDADKGRGGGVKLHRNWGLGRLSLTDQESIDLLISLAISEKMNSPLFMDNLKSIRYKLMALLSPDQKLNIKNLRSRILIGSSASPQIISSYELSSSNQAIELNAAFLFKKQLSISYSDESNVITERRIEPHYLYLNYPVWYILAWDHLRAAFRTFRCDRISKPLVIEKSFKVRPFIDFTHMIKTDNPTLP